MGMPVENLVSPGHLREVCWAPPENPVADALHVALTSHGVRDWQAVRVAPLLAEAFALATKQLEAAELADAAADSVLPESDEKIDSSTP
jgi:enterochelin esterase-like enzyme